MVEECKSINDPTFVSFNTNRDPDWMYGVIIDSGACSSIVGKKTLDKALVKLKSDKLIYAVPSRPHPRFCTSEEQHNSLFAVRFPFYSTDQPDPLFNIQFDFIDGSLPFLVGLPTLIAMKSSINFNSRWLGVRTGESRDDYVKLSLHCEEEHLILPFRSSPKRDERRNFRNGDSNSYYSPGSYCPKTQGDGYSSEDSESSGVYPSDDSEE